MSCRASFSGMPSRRQAEEALLRVHRLPATMRAAWWRIDDLDDAPQWVRQLVDDLQRFAERRAGRFFGRADFERASDAVRAACDRGVPPHWLGTNQLLRRVGGQVWRTGAARAVGSVMAKNLFPARRALSSRACRRRQAGRLFGARRVADEAAVA